MGDLLSRLAAGYGASLPPKISMLVGSFCETGCSRAGTTGWERSGESDTHFVDLVARGDAVLSLEWRELLFSGQGVGLTIIAQRLDARGRVLSRSSPSNPSSIKRSCQRQTQVFDLAVRRIIAFVPTPPAVNSTISARQTCFCAVLRS
jgi:hypothetical protein